MTTEGSARENVLLLCLSKVSFDRGLTKYVYRNPPNKDIAVDGYMTNEAPAKVALRLVELDRIVVICSEEVRKNSRPPKEGEDKDSVQEKHYKYYERVIKEFAKKEGRKKPNFFPVEIPNNPTEFDIAKAAVEAAEKVLDASGDEKDIHVYIDYNGGLRYIAASLLNIANLMVQRGAIVENIFTMNFENRDSNEPVLVENLKGIMQSSRLVSGITEYVDYARCRELKKYFENSEEITCIINQMNALSHNFNLCDVSRIFAQRGENDEEPPEGSIEKVRVLLEDYIQKQVRMIDDPLAVLFQYVAKDILKEYHPLFQDDLLDMIDWCRKKDFIQQAVTFYAERMPVYFWEHHIYYPTEEEENEYKQIKRACESYEHFMENRSYKEASGNKKNSVMLLLLQQEPDGPCQRMSTQDQVKNLKRDYVSYDWKAVWMVKYLMFSNDKDHEWMLGDKRLTTVNYAGNSPFNNERAQTDYDERAVKGILKNYVEIKKQRDYINHVEGKGIDLSKRWEYDKLVTRLKNYVDKIRKLINQ